MKEVLSEDIEEAEIKLIVFCEYDAMVFWDIPSSFDELIDWVNSNFTTEASKFKLIFFISLDETVTLENYSDFESCFEMVWRAGFHVLKLAVKFPKEIIDEVVKT